MNISEVLKETNEILEKENVIDSKQKARRLLAYSLNKSKEYLMIHEKEEVPEKIYKNYLENVERLKNHEPIQYILKNQEFMGFDFYVDKNVLIPQPDTENLVEEVINIAEKNNLKQPKI
ncbi:MAG: protein-(glutamine-N5) methyltransferase, release factor-specific, partial [Oscillospiraceae bacterium]|nr:protein-(glutamine-N5) methyltransferase, release factor-specific [Oscillospiraceae bacterium]